MVSRLRSYVPDLTTDDHPWAAVIHSGRSQIIEMVTDDYLRSIAHDAIHLGLLRELAPTSQIIIPLAARGRILGSLLFATDSDSGRRYVDHDVAIATEVGRRMSLAVDNATLYRAAEQAAHTREFIICDNGPGIAEEDLKHVFERYWQAQKTKCMGSGLGLPIAKRLIEAHGGDIRADSRLGEDPSPAHRQGNSAVPQRLGGRAEASSRFALPEPWPFFLNLEQFAEPLRSE